MTEHSLAERPADFTPWPAEAAAGYRAAGYWRGQTFPEFLAERAEAFPDRLAVVDSQTRLTYGELAERSLRLAYGLRGIGISPGDRVLVQLPNRAEFLVLWFALARLGAIPVHTQPGHRLSEISHLAALSAATAYVIPDRHDRFDHRELAAQVRSASPHLRHVIVIGDPGPHLSFDELAAAAPAGPPVTSPASAGDPALLLLSGGTTGLPKLIPRTHDDYLYNGRTAAEVCGLDRHSVYLAVLPVAFNYTMNCPGVLGTLGAGGTVVLASSPDPGVCFPLIAQERVTITAINPPLTPVWLEEAARGTADLSSLRVLQIGSARLADDLARRVSAELPGALQQIFGMAEGLICVTRLDDPPELVHTTQGRPISPADELLVVDEHGTPVSDGEVGELLTRGPYTLRGYYRADEHNATAFTDGYYRTGDLVRRLPSGHLVVVGRRKDQINRGGLKFAAPEVEGHLQAHPDIHAAALLPVPDLNLGERTVAFVVAAGDQPPDRRQLASFLAERGVARYKTPDEVRVVPELPLTPVGKVDKNALAGRLGPDPAPAGEGR